MKVSATSKLVLNYLALPMGLGGRGGALRFFLLSQDIPFEEKLFAMGDEWAAEKKRLRTSGENPSSKTPVVYADGTPLPEHIATGRLLAHVHECASPDFYRNYVQDLAADEYQGFRDTWVHHAFSASDEEKASYTSEGLPQKLEQFDALYGCFKTHDTFLSISDKTGRPLWGDAACFGLLRDNILTGMMSREDVSQYKELDSMYTAYEKIPSIEKWIDSKK
ncbi:MAG: hypothetical protein SGBAC_009278 [Bacillariaceae sp.]